MVADKETTNYVAVKELKWNAFTTLVYNITR